MEILELNNTVTKILKTLLDGLYSRTEMTKERVNEIYDKSKEIIQCENQ